MASKKVKAKKANTPSRVPMVNAYTVGGRAARPLDPLRERVTSVIKAVKTSIDNSIAARRGSYRAANNPRSRLQTPYGGSGDQHVDPWSRRMMRELARDMDRNADTFGVVMDYFAHVIVGDGVRVRPTSSDKKWNDEVTRKIHDKFSSSENGLDSRRRDSWYQLQAHIVRAFGVDGECGMVKLTNGMLQIVESEQITTGDAGGASNNLDGITLNDDGSFNRFHVCPYSITGALDQGDAVDYTAEQFMFMANIRRYSQTRGVPILTAALDDWERIDSYRESEIIAAEQGAQIYGAIEHQPGDMGAGSPFTTSDPTLDPAEVIRGGLNSGGNIDWQASVHGSLLDLPNGKKYVPVNPQRPNRDCAPFLIELLRSFCAVTGCPYEFVYNDLRGLSWSVNRALVVQCRDRVKTWQTQKFAQRFTDVYLWTLAQMIETGEVPPAPADWKNHEHQWPQISWPDEGKEYEAQTVGLQRALTTRHRLFGPQWQTLLEERFEELDFASILAKKHNTTHPEFPVKPWFFLGFDPEDLVTMRRMSGGDELKKNSPANPDERKSKDDTASKGPPKNKEDAEVSFDPGQQPTA